MKLDPLRLNPWCSLIYNNAGIKQFIFQELIFIQGLEERLNHTNKTKIRVALTYHIELSDADSVPKKYGASV